MAPTSSSSRRVVRAPNKAAAKPKNKVERKARGRSFHDLALMLVGKGHDHIVKLFEQGEITRDAIRKTLEHVKEEYPQQFDLLNAWFQKLPVNRGNPSGPQDGEERVYRAQQLTTGTAFIRVPVGLIAEKGDEIFVHFSEHDGIIIRNKSQNRRRAMPLAAAGGGVAAPPAVALGVV